jgi:S1-C subfamily serine protease
MLIHKSIAAALAFAAPLVGQNAPCVVGPGALYGVVAYQCANCGFKQELGAVPSVTFFAEPVVTETSPGSAVANGDVIIAVDGNPITTRAGADRFTYPASGPHTLTVRRGRERQEIRVDLNTNCTASAIGTGSGRIGTLRGRTGVGGGVATAAGGRGISSNVGRGVASGGAISNVGSFSDDCGDLARTQLIGARGAVIVDSVSPRDPLIIIDGVRQSPAKGRYGFAVTARPICHKEGSGDGVYYSYRYSYHYDQAPPIYDVRPGSAADKAGLRAGDLIVKIDGRSVLDNPVLLTGADQREPLHMTVLRDGKEINVVLVATP